MIKMSNGGKLPKLFEPGFIGRMEVRNRIIMPPMVHHYSDENGFVTAQMVEYYSVRAKGGAGVVIPECCYPRAYKGRLSINSDEFIPGLKKLADAIKKMEPGLSCS